MPRAPAEGSGQNSNSLSCIHECVLGSCRRAQLIASPAGHLIAPRGLERVGDVSNVAFTNGAVLAGKQVHLYYASSDTRLHVATAELEEILDWVLKTPEDPLRSQLCAGQRASLVEKNSKSALKLAPALKKGLQAQLAAKKGKRP